MVRCQQCKKVLGPGFDTMPRKPCPDCGSDKRDISITPAPAVLTLTGGEVIFRLGTSLKWEDQWRMLNEAMGDFNKPVAGSADGKSIQKLGQAMRTFYVEAFNLLDRLKADKPKGISESAVHAAFKSEPALCLLADVANLHKHTELTKTPWTKQVPKFGRLEGTSTPGGWRLCHEVIHDGKTLDGLDVAREAMAAWKRVLKGLGLS